MLRGPNLICEKLYFKKLIVRPWLKELALFDLKIEFYASKSPPGSLPEVWKREICIKYDKFMFEYVFLTCSCGYSRNKRDFK